MWARARIAHAVPANNVSNPMNAMLQGKTILAHLFQNQPLKQQACVIFKLIYLFCLFFRPCAEPQPTDHRCRAEKVSAFINAPINGEFSLSFDFDSWKLLDKFSRRRRSHLLLPASSHFWNDGSTGSMLEWLPPLSTENGICLSQQMKRKWNKWFSAGDWELSEMEA